MVALDDWNGIRDTLFTYTGLLLAVTIPLSALLIYISEPVIALLFQRGAFTESDAKIVGEVQAMYLLQVPPCIAGMLTVRLISAMRATHIMLWGNIINIILCVVLTYLLMRRFGVVGIALATSVMYVISFCFLFVASARCLATKTSVQAGA